MATQELIKSIEAKKLNKRSKLPLPEPPVTIPYGALVTNLEHDGGMMRFSYLGELYHCPEDRLMSALGGKAAPAAASAPAPAAAGAGAPVVAAQPAAAAEEARFGWEELATSLGPVWRAKVPGGWLLTGSAGAGRSVTFYPDARHEWDGGTLE
jgi:hypothetical protein